MTDKGATTQPVLVSLSALAGIGIGLLMFSVSREVLAVISETLVGTGLLGLVVVAVAALWRVVAGSGPDPGGDDQDPPGDGTPILPLSNLDAELFALLDQEAMRREFSGDPRRVKP
jgi:hypothetical protein